MERDYDDTEAERERENVCHSDVTFASSADMQCLVSLSSTNTDKAARTKSHQMFKITAASSNTHLKFSAPLIESLFHLIAHPYNSLLQLINIINLLLIESVLQLKNQSYSIDDNSFVNKKTIFLKFYCVFF